MAKAYWISIYRSISDPDKLAAYAKLAGPAITAGGGRTLARGVAAQVYEAGLKERTVLIEFDSVEAARKAHDSPAYRRRCASSPADASARFASSRAWRRLKSRWSSRKRSFWKGRENIASEARARPSTRRFDESKLFCGCRSPAFGALLTSIRRMSIRRASVSPPRDF